MQPILLNPGPVNVSERVRAALARGDACHREPEVAASLASARSLLLDLFAPGGGHEAVLFTGSGTAAVEAAVCSTVAHGRRLLVIENGVYGERIRAIAAAHEIEVVRIGCEWRQPPDLAEVQAALAADERIETVAMVHNETTTGLLNPVREVGRLTARYGKRFLLDAVSSLGGEELDLPGWGVDVAASSANKCLAGLPGISFVLVGTEALEHMRGNPVRSHYLNVPLNRDAQLDGCGAFTPAVQILWALEEALHELAEEGVEQRIARFARASARIRERVPELGMELYLDPALYSNTISSFRLSGGCGYAELHDELKSRGFVIYAGQGPLAGEIFRVATMGHVSMQDYERFLTTLAEVVS